MDEPGSDPLAVLLAWYREARERNSPEPEAMTLATATGLGLPSARLVLFKGVDAGDIQFVSNYASRKGREIAENPEVALVFFWSALMRQVRIEGTARRAPAAASDEYFKSRPRESQLGAWASAQSEVISSRAELEQRYAEVEGRFRGREVERPENWGLYLVTPRAVELWLSGSHRLHDRFRYERRADAWSVARLSP